MKTIAQLDCCLSDLTDRVDVLTTNNVVTDATTAFSDGAIDALIAASLRQKYSSDTPSEETIEAAIKAASINDPEDAERLLRIRNRLNQTLRPSALSPDENHRPA